MELSPDLVGPSITRNSGIIGQGVDLNLQHLGEPRPSTRLFHVTQRLLYTKFRDPGEEPKLHLFGQLKRITKQRIGTYLVCKGETYPALLMYQELADMACNRITAGITRRFIGERPIKALLDPYNPTGSTKFVRFNTSKTLRWETSSDRCHVNWAILDSDWEAEFSRVAESHPKVRAYVKNHNLGLEAPHRYGSETRKYIPDYISLVDDGHGEDDLLHLIVEIKGYRREDAKEKKSTMENYLTFVECKKYARAHRVGVDVIREVYGVHHLYRVNKSLIVTTSSFTRDAREEVSKMKYEMELKDYEDVKGWLAEIQAKRYGC